MFWIMGLNVGGARPQVNCNLNEVEQALGRPAASMEDLMMAPTRPLTNAESLYVMGMQEQNTKKA